MDDKDRRGYRRLWYKGTSFPSHQSTSSDSIPTSRQSPSTRPVVKGLPETTAGERESWSHRADAQLMSDKHRWMANEEQAEENGLKMCQGKREQQQVAVASLGEALSTLLGHAPRRGVLPVRVQAPRSRGRTLAATEQDVRQVQPQTCHAWGDEGGKNGDNSSSQRQHVQSRLEDCEDQGGSGQQVEFRFLHDEVIDIRDHRVRQSEMLQSCFGGHEIAINEDVCHLIVEQANQAWNQLQTEACMHACGACVSSN